MTGESNDDAILHASDVWVGVKVGKNIKPIVQGGQLVVPRGGILGLVGESGSGKTQFVRAVMGLSSLEPGVITGSAVYSVDGAEPIDVLQDIDEYSPFRPPRDGELYPQRQRIGWGWLMWRRRFRKRLAMLRKLGVGFIFQNPMGALNPFLNVGSQIGEAVRVARPDATKADMEAGAIEWLAQVHLKAEKETLALYPHELSGGMAQRVMIALALAAEPKFVVADEPTTGLDSHIRREVVGLLHRIMKGGELSGIVISHDLPMVAKLCDKLTVMYRGRVIEVGPIDALGDQDAPNHPYTRMLKERAEDLARGRHGGVVRVGTASPDATGVTVAAGCIYRRRCLVYETGLVEKADCDKVQPGLTPIAENHEVACHADDQKVLSDLAAISTQAHMQQLDEKDFYPDGIPRRGQADG
ncbi:MAG: ABC transporter ATP-binding protein [Proteobacteria bacterium]|nr:ABC transporter ATP-binding protein [Pseudomonadota bacterium]